MDSDYISEEVVDQLTYPIIKWPSGTIQYLRPDLSWTSIPDDRRVGSKPSWQLFLIFS